MTFEHLGDRRHSVSDFIILVAAAGIALATWAALDHGVPVPLWKAAVSVVTTLLLALAALTRHPDWEVRLKRLAAGWILATPFLLGFAHALPVLAVHAVLGGVVLAAASPVMLPVRVRRRSTAPDPDLLPAAPRR